MPELIMAGKVYRAVPPLFGIKSSRGGETKYFTTKLDFTKYVQNLFAKTYVLADMSGRKLTTSETTALFFKNIDYKDQMDFIASTFAVDPDLLESVLYYLAKYVEIGRPDAVANMAAKVKLATKTKTKIKDNEKKKTTSTKKETSKSSASNTSSDDDEGINFEDVPVTEGSVSASVAYYVKPTFDAKALKSELKKSYRFIDLIESNGVVRIEGLVNSKYQYLFINDKFISSCIPLITVIKNNINLYYQVDGEKTSLYSLMSKFNSMIPAGLTRFKGLGEQDPEELAVSALRPDGDRSLIRYTLDSAKEEIETLRRIDSSMSSLLRDIKITKADIE